MRVRVLALLSALVLWVIAAMPTSASSEGHSYLALGDSVSFGFNPHLDPTVASHFTGYPEIVAKRLNIEDVNAACSGEATGSFISLTGLDNSCRDYRFRFNLPLHVSYSGTQLAFAVDYLKHNPRTRLVTLMLDANDFFRVSSGKPGTPWPPSTCFVPDLVTYFATCAVQNLTTIFSAIRGTGYNGLLVVVTYYALNYHDPLSVFVSQGLLNKAMLTAAAPFHVVVAHGYEALEAAAAPFNGDSCAAGLLLPAAPLGTPGCDVHPTPKGRDLLAGAVIDAIAGTCPAADAIGCLNRNQA
jgi:lysophospholipase L1-like esterase